MNHALYLLSGALPIIDLYVIIGERAMAAAEEAGKGLNKVDLEKVDYAKLLQEIGTDVAANQPLSDAIIRSIAHGVALERIMVPGFASTFELEFRQEAELLREKMNNGELGGEFIELAARLANLAKELTLQFKGLKPRTSTDVFTIVQTIMDRLRGIATMSAGAP